MIPHWNWLNYKLLLVAVICVVVYTEAGAAADDALVVETALLNALTSSSVVENTIGTTGSKETILFRVGTARAYQTASTILKGEMAPFTDFPPETQAAFREAAEDVMRRVNSGDGLTTPSFYDARIQVESNTSTGPQDIRRWWERPQVFGVLPPGYSASGEYALVHVGTTWSGGMHSMELVFYLRRTQSGWVVLDRAEVRYV